MLPLEKARALLGRYDLCDDCLGRQFAYAMESNDNEARGKALREALGDDYSGAPDPAKCFICGEVRQQLSELEQQVPLRMSGISCQTFLVGVSMPDEVVKREDELRMRYSLLDGESIRREFSREVGKRLAQNLGLEIDFERPDVSIIFDLAGRPPKLDLQVNPLFVFGRYRKLERGISQTRRHCPSCHGKGCEVCLFTGYEPGESIESMVSKPILEAFGGSEYKFHGGGREDLDARMLGNGRPFVVEVSRPSTRTADLREIQEGINAKWRGKIEVLALRPSSRREMQNIKTKKFDKTYELEISFSEKPADDVLSTLAESMTGCEIRQQTPTRVMPRRKDMTRRRMVKDFEILSTDAQGKRARIRLRAESGLYIKELATGDGGRTQPNIKDLLGVEAVTVESLDVVSVHDNLQ